MGRTRIFVDFWNFQINWNVRTGRARIDWSKLPQILTAASSSKLSAAGVAMPLMLEETRVYYSYNPAVKEDRNLRHWMNTYLDRQPGIRVFEKPRKYEKRTV